MQRGEINTFNKLLYVRVKNKELYSVCAPLLSACSCLPSDMFEWRSMRLQEALPLSARFHRETLPVSTYADAAGPGCQGQQAARLLHSSEARQHETAGGDKHRAHADDANALGVHAATIAGAPLVRR